MISIKLSPICFICLVVIVAVNVLVAVFFTGGQQAELKRVVEGTSHSLVGPHFVKYFMDSFSVMDISPLCFEQSGTERHLFSPDVQLLERCLEKNNSNCKCFEWNCPEYFHLADWPAIENKSKFGLTPIWVPGTSVFNALSPSGDNIYHCLNQLIGGWHASYHANLLNLSLVDRVFVGVGDPKNANGWVMSILQTIWDGFNISSLEMFSFQSALPLEKQIFILSEEFPFSAGSKYFSQAFGTNHSVCFERVVLTGLSMFPALGSSGKCHSGVMASTEAFQTRVRNLLKKPAVHLARRKLVFGRRSKFNSRRNGISSFLMPTEEAKLLDLLSTKCNLHNFEFVVTGFHGAFRDQYEVVEDAAIFVSIHGTILLNPCLFMPCNATVIDIVGSTRRTLYFANGLHTGVRYIQVKADSENNATFGIYLSTEEWKMLDDVLESTMKSFVSSKG